MTKTPQIMFRIKADDYALVAQAAAEAGNVPPSIFCRSIVLAYLTGALVDASKNADANFLAGKVAALVEKIEQLTTESDSRQAEVSKGLDALEKKLNDSIPEVFSQLVKLAGMSSRIDQKASAVLTEAENINNSLPLVTETLSALRADVARLENPPEDAHGYDRPATFGGPERRTGERRGS